MKIAMANTFLPDLEKGGVSFQVHYLGNQLAARGHDVTIYTFADGPQDAQYRVHRFSRIPGLRKRFYAFVQAVLLSKTDFSDYDALHVHGDNYLLNKTQPHVRTFYGAARDEARAAPTWRRKMFYSMMAPLEELGTRKATWNVGISEATKRSLPAIDEVIPCGVDLSHFTPGKKSEQPSILFIGGLEGRKRGAALVETFIRQIHPIMPAAELWLVSEAAISHPAVTVFGKIPLEQLSELYRRAWIFCMPSSYEGFGVPYVEAMASGTAVLSTPNGGADEVLDAGRCGKLCDLDQLGPSLLELLRNDPIRTRLAEVGVSWAQRYDWSSVVAAYERTYEYTMNVGRCR